MSKIYEKVNADLKTAMLNKDQTRVMILRIMRSMFDLAKNEKNAKVFDDAKAVQVLIKLKNQRIEAAALFDKGNRPELVAKEESEALIISEYLPAEATEKQLVEMIKDSVASMSAPNLGIVIKDVKVKLQSLNLIADGGKLSALVKTIL